MSKIYGYKEEDVLGLIKFLKERKNRPLSEVFRLYSEMTGKAKGTVRNLYYAIAKTSKTDSEFCKEYLDGNPLPVESIENFSEQEETSLVRTVLIGQKEGKSARSVIMDLAQGDAKKALRFQNKFRNAVKNKPRMIAELVRELKMTDSDIHKNDKKDEYVSVISDAQLKKIKDEINGLVGRIALKTKRENERLKERVSILERENLRLSALLYGEVKNPKAVRFFRAPNGEGMIN